MRANSVSSLPRPTLRPGLWGVPRWRTRIVPACTSCPAKRVTPLFDNLANDLGLRGLRAGQQLLLVGANCKDIFKGDLAAYLAGQALDLDGLARCDTVLLVATADHGVHTASRSNRETFIIRAPRQSRQRTLDGFCVE